jgi:GDSL-like lipase/acylhydrolase family protein
MRSAPMALWLWTFTTGSVALGTILYESDANRVFFNRYSPPWLAVVCLSLLAFGTLGAVAFWKSVRVRKAPTEKDASSWKYDLLFGAAAASWGASLLTQYPLAPGQVGRFFRGEFLGATQAPGVLLEYLAQILVGFTVVLFLVTRAFRVRTGRSRLSHGLIALSALVVAYLIAEGTVRIANIAVPRVQGVPTKATRIWAQRYGSVNSLGYRDGEFERRLDPKELRVLVVGDSMTYGAGIADPKHRFTDVLAARLNATPSIGRVRVFNAGVPDRDSVHELRMLDELLWLDPDLVLLAYVFNDIEHVLRTPRPPIFDPPSYLARFNLQRLLMLNSHLFDQLLLRYRLMTGKSARDPMLDAYADPELLRKHLDVLVEIKERANAAGAAFHLVPFDPAVRNGPPYEARYQTFVRACRERQIQVWPMDGIFDGLPYEALIVNGWDHHANERAHRLVGEFLAEKILSDKDVLTRIAKRRSHHVAETGALNGVGGRT